MLAKLIPFTLIWTVISTILHCSGVGNFADWAIVSWPWKWSCFCVLEWNIIAWAVVFIIAFVVMIYVRVRKPANPFVNKEE